MAKVNLHYLGLVSNTILGTSKQHSNTSTSSYYLTY